MQTLLTTGPGSRGRCFYARGSKRCVARWSGTIAWQVTGH